MPVDEHNRPYYPSQKSSIPYESVETVTNPSTGKILGNRQVVKHIEFPEERNYDLTSMGWVKKLTFTFLTTKVGIVDPKLMNFGRFYVIQTQFADSKNYPCSRCGGTDEHVFLRLMESGVYRRCFHCDSTTGPMATAGNSFSKMKLLSEKRVTPSEIVEAYRNGTLQLVDLSDKQRFGLRR